MSPHPITARKPPAVKAPYPELPDSESKAFWLAAYLCYQAELEQLRKITEAKGFWRKNSALQHAIYGAIRHQHDEIKLALGYTVQEGLLPFAHAHTTYFDQQVPA